MIKMRNFLLTLALILSGGAASADNSPGLIGWGGETIFKVADLPDIDYFKFDKDFLDIGMVYKSINIFFLSVWQYDKKYVFVAPGNQRFYYDLGEDEVMEAAKTANIPLPPVSKVNLGFWTAWGGKIVFVFLVLLAIAVSRSQRKKKNLDDAP